ncbi:hypothetical protein CNR22_00585 [Sphingobacteriaceae bacterium]|nr:hypothetical protein CNR22_00585 [Sphingobacteriaceae bacterium]
MSKPVIIIMDTTPSFFPLIKAAGKDNTYDRFLKEKDTCSMHMTLAPYSSNSFPDKKKKQTYKLGVSIKNRLKL